MAVEASSRRGVRRTCDAFVCEEISCSASTTMVRKLIQLASHRSGLDQHRRGVGGLLTATRFSKMPSRTIRASCSSSLSRNAQECSRLLLVISLIILLGPPAVLLVLSLSNVDDAFKLREELLVTLVMGLLLTGMYGQRLHILLYARVCGLL